ncbi:PREDICTED: uncharacterized protein LOC106807431 isoform X2 [Priapulus caudatus]|uniref:Uncharacterized protein LOC106807431 isoform X2 n=1 Tax=Priapulus caudatus TaxID=37621 RepID=A0ABM1DZ70_PRICU|nr:PREDICTED: uncharacterized protein LOC106807431 isoform X2 [Priapulus caudatus]
MLNCFTSHRIPALQQIVNGVLYGTTEVRNLLLYECTVIYECCLCHSLFRGLPNFVAHKRLYCTESYKNSSVKFPSNTSEDETIVIQPVSPNQTVECEVEPPDTTSNLSKPGTSDAVQFYDSILDVQAERWDQKKITTVKLQSIKNNPNAVYQTVVNGDKEEQNVEPWKSPEETVVTVIPQECEKSTRVTSRSVPEYKLLRMRAMQKAEKCHASKTSATSTGPKTAVKVTPIPSRSADGTNIEKISLFKPPYCSVEKLTCLLCSTKYSSLKTLKIHMTSVHAERRKVYPCTECRSQFVHCWGAVRHLVKVHHKSKDDIKELRDMIKKRASFKNIFPVAPMRQRVQEDITENQDEEMTAEEEAPEDMSAEDEPLCNEIGSEPEECLLLGEAAHVKNDKAEMDIEQRDELVRQESSQELSSVCVGSLVLHKCVKCNKMFGHKDTLLKHQDVCTEQSHKTVSSLFKGKNRGKGQAKDRIEPMIQCEMPLDPTTWEQKIMVHIDRVRRKCLLCGDKYSSLSNTKRHVQLHLGWKRFECQICGFQNFNRGDIRSHLCRSHEDKLKGLKSPDKLITDLVLGETTEEGSLAARRMPIQSRNAKPVIKNLMSAASSSRRKSQPTHFASSSSSEYSIKYRTTSQSRAERMPCRPAVSPFNISTRNTPRTYDLTPCVRTMRTEMVVTRSADKLSTLKTRSGSYQKRVPTEQQLKRITGKRVAVKSEPGADADSQNNEFHVDADSDTGSSVQGDPFDRNSESQDTSYSGQNCDSDQASNYSGRHKFALPSSTGVEPGVFIQSDSTGHLCDSENSHQDNERSVSRADDCASSSENTMKEDSKIPQMSLALSENYITENQSVTCTNLPVQFNTCRVRLQRSSIVNQTGKQQSQPHVAGSKEVSAEIKPLAAVHQATAAWLQAKAAAQRCVISAPKHAISSEPLQSGADQQRLQADDQGQMSCDESIQSGHPISDISNKQTLQAPSELTIAQGPEVIAEERSPEVGRLTSVQQLDTEVEQVCDVPIDAATVAKDNLVSTTTCMLAATSAKVASPTSTSAAPEAMSQSILSVQAGTPVLHLGTLFKQCITLPTTQSGITTGTGSAVVSQPIMMTSQPLGKNAVIVTSGLHSTITLGATQATSGGIQAVRISENQVILQGPRPVNVTSNQHVIRTQPVVSTQILPQRSAPRITVLPRKRIFPIGQKVVPIRPLSAPPYQQCFAPVRQSLSLTLRQPPPLVRFQEPRSQSLLPKQLIRTTPRHTHEQVASKQETVSAMQLGASRVETSQDNSAVYLPTGRSQDNKETVGFDASTQETLSGDQIMSNAELATFPEHFIVDSGNEQLDNDSTTLQHASNVLQDTQHVYVDIGNLIHLDDGQYVVAEEVVGE